MAANRITSVERLTCNRIFRHLAVYVDRGFTGRVEIGCLSETTLSWSIYLIWGRVVWATGGEHPRRRWCRQLRAVTGKKPRIPEMGADPCGDYQELCRLYRQAAIASDLARAVLCGILAEVLFDIVQAFEQLPLARVNGYESLMDISILAEVGDNLSPIPHPGDTLGSMRLPPDWSPTLESLRRQVQSRWEQWVQWGLAECSPNLAPTIRDARSLQQHASPLAYNNLCQLLDGTRTLRDISLRFKDVRRDLYKAARGLAPYIRSGAIALERTEDLLESGTKDSDRPLAICIDRDRHTCDRVELASMEAGYQFVNILHPYEAIHQLKCWTATPPTVLFVAADRLPLSGEEFCRLLRHLPSLAGVPLILYGSGPSEPECQQQLLQAGATALLCGNEACNTQTLLALLMRYKPHREPYGDRPVANEMIGSELTEDDLDVTVTLPNYR